MRTYIVLVYIHVLENANTETEKLVCIRIIKSSIYFLSL